MLLLRTSLRIDAAGVTPTHVVCMQRLTDELFSWIGKLMCKSHLTGVVCNGTTARQGRLADGEIDLGICRDGVARL